MAGPKLLDKKVVNAEIATQRKQQIDIGLSLSKKVDAVRDSLGEEQRNLETFRSSTVTSVQKEIDAKVQERDLIEKGNIFLREERMRLSAPVDLKEAWQKVNDDKAYVEAWKSKLAEKEVYAIAREADTVSLETQLSQRTSQIITKETLIAKTVEETVEKHELASSILKKAQKEAKVLVENAETRENAVTVREQLVSNLVESLSEREEKVSAHEIDLANRELALKDRYETFIKAQTYINSQK